MRHIDWQAYEDGSLAPEAMEAAKRLLESDPYASEEWKGLKAFREETRRQGMDVDVPAADLAHMLREVVRAERPQQRFSWVRVSIPAAAAILIALGLWWYKHDPMEFATTPVAAVLESTEPDEAEAWIERNTGYDVPDLQLPQEATVVMARYGEQKTWACIDFMHDGKLYFLYMRKDGAPLGTHPVRIFDGHGYYEGQGVGWKTANLSYYIKGGTREGRWSFATHLAPQTLQSQAADGPRRL